MEKVSFSIVFFCNNDFFKNIIVRKVKWEVRLFQFISVDPFNSS